MNLLLQPNDNPNKMYNNHTSIINIINFNY